MSFIKKYPEFKGVENKSIDKFLTYNMIFSNDVEKILDKHFVRKEELKQFEELKKFIDSYFKKYLLTKEKVKEAMFKLNNLKGYEFKEFVKDLELE